MKNQSWHYEPETETVRDAKNHCLFSARTFANGGSFDAANFKDRERILRLAAAAPELVKALESIRIQVGGDLHGDALVNYMDGIARAALRKAGVE